MGSRDLSLVVITASRSFPALAPTFLLLCVIVPHNGFS